MKNKFYFIVDSRNECIEKIKGDVIIDKDQFTKYVGSLGYFANDEIFEDEANAKESLRSLLQNRLLIIQARLSKL